MPEPSPHPPTFVEQTEPGHFICAARCKWFRHTHVGAFCVSSVGEYDRDGNGIHHSLGGSSPDTLYETMVFPSDPDGHTASWTELDGTRYSTRDEANRGHEATCHEVATWKGWVWNSDETEVIVERMPQATEPDPPREHDCPRSSQNHAAILLESCAKGLHAWQLFTNTGVYYPTRRHLQCVVCDAVVSLPLDDQGKVSADA